MGGPARSRGSRTMGQSLWLRSLSAGAGIAAIAAAAAPAAAQSHRFHDDHILGTSLDVVAVGGEGSALVAVAAARAEIARLDRILSGWRDDSELSGLNRRVADGAAIPVSDDLFGVVAAAERWRAASDGVFDARRVDSGRAMPDAVVLDPAARSVTRPDGLRLDLDGVAKGWIVDAAVAAARRAAPDLAGLMVDIGGDVRCWGSGPAGGCWRIGVASAGRMDETAPAAAVLAIADGAVASSGSAARGGHILSPADGRPAARPHAATVVAGSTADADALATAFTLLPPERSLRIAAGLPGVEAMIVADDGRTWLTDGWDGLTAGDAGMLRSSDAASAWPAGQALTVGYQIPKIEAENYRAPYVAIWVTDEKRQLVRTLLLLGNEARWLDSNYVWWRRYGRKTEGLDAMTKPSRQPGTYSAVWDGTTDDGARAAPGRYLIHVEAAREHGGHTYQSAELDLGAEPAEVSIPAKEELGALTMRYGKTP